MVIGGYSMVMNYENIINSPIETLAEWLMEFIEEIPFDSVDTKENLITAQRLTRKFANEYAYLTGLYSYAQIKVRKTKNENVMDKQKINHLIDVRDSIGRTMDAVKTLLRAVSRMVTIQDDIKYEEQSAGWLE